MVAEIEAAAAEPWAWGRHDCASFAARVAAAIVRGPTAWGALLGRHDNARGAVAVLRPYGGCLRNAMNAFVDEIDPRQARRGDVAAVRLRAGAPHPDGRVALAVVEGETLVAAAAHGVTRNARGVMVAAWPVEAPHG